MFKHKIKKSTNSLKLVVNWNLPKLTPFHSTHSNFTLATFQDLPSLSLKHFIFFHYGFSLCIYCWHAQCLFLCFLHYNVLEASPMSSTSYIAKNNTWDLTYVWGCDLILWILFWVEVMDVTDWDYMKKKAIVCVCVCAYETWAISLGWNHFLKDWIRPPNQLLAH